MTHVRGDQIDAAHHEGVELVIERIPERRREDDGAPRSALMMVVDYLRVPAPVEDPRNGLALDCVAGIEVAVVVMAHVALIKHRHPPHPTRRHVGVGDEFHAIGIRGTNEQDDLVEDVANLRVIAGTHPVGEFDNILGGHALGGMHSSIDPNDGATISG